jgi:hypothetical protein
MIKFGVFKKTGKWLEYVLQLSEHQGSIRKSSAL